MGEIAKLASDPAARALAKFAAARGITPTLLAKLVKGERGGVDVDRRSLQRSFLAERPRRDTLREIAKALDAVRLGRALLRELTPHDAEDILNDIRFEILSKERSRFGRGRSAWSDISKALRQADIDLRYSAYISFEIANNELDSQGRRPLDALAQTLRFDLSPYEQSKYDRLLYAWGAADQLTRALRLSESDQEILTDLLVRNGFDEATIRHFVPQTLEEKATLSEDDL